MNKSTFKDQKDKYDSELLKGYGNVRLLRKLLNRIEEWNKLFTTKRTQEK